MKQDLTLLTKTKIFLDDERVPLDAHDFIVVRNYNEFITCVTQNWQVRGLDFISFDHDLGPDSLTGYDCVKWLVDYDMGLDGEVLTTNFKYYVHSQNPIGANNIRGYLKRYFELKYGDEFWESIKDYRDLRF